MNTQLKRLTHELIESNIVRNGEYYDEEEANKMAAMQVLLSQEPSNDESLIVDAFKGLLHAFQNMDGEVAPIHIIYRGASYTFHDASIDLNEMFIDFLAVALEFAQKEDL